MNWLLAAAFDAKSKDSNIRFESSRYKIPYRDTLKKKTGWRKFAYAVTR